VAGGGRRRRKQLLNDVEEKRRYWILNEEAPDRSVWRTRCGRAVVLSQDGLQNE
jgi:hypothetical protein